MNGIEKARKASGITLEKAAGITNMSIPTYMKREKEPWLFTMGEFCALRREIDEGLLPFFDAEYETLCTKKFT